MINRLMNTIRNARSLTELEGFHRAEMREAGVTDAAFQAFVSGR